jgi:glycosyltransferase involved in cell wall biosynthesis
MRIGIDATALPSQPVGAGNYIINLIRALSRLDSEHKFVVFAQDSRRDLFEGLQASRLEWVWLAGKHPALRLVWEQTAFPGLVRQFRLDLLHSLHYTRPFNLPCKSVVTFHDMTFFLFPGLHTRSKRLFFPLAIRLSARTADALIADSESTRQDALRLLKVPPDKIFTVPLGVDESFHPVSDALLLDGVRRKYNLPARFILYVGLVEPRKNLPLLLQAYKVLAQKAIDCPLVIVGRFGWSHQRILQQIDELGLKEKVLLTGYVPARDLPIVYNLADVFVYPSVYEGFGLPPLEAMACGTPVITTAVSSMPEHVGDAGLLVPPDDLPALAQALQDVLTDQALREHLAHKGPRQAAKYTWERTARQTLHVYQKLI